MLNLSDKDLDRLSQEAAQQYEPEDIGPKLWEKLEARLDRDLGKVNLNPARGIRRLPYYYAPVLLLILGVGYYFVRPGAKSSKGSSSGGPPVSVLPPPAGSHPDDNSSTNPVQSDRNNSTQTLSSKTVPFPGSHDDASSAAGSPRAAGTAPAAGDATGASPGTRGSDVATSSANRAHMAASPAVRGRVAETPGTRGSAAAPSDVGAGPSFAPSIAAGVRRHHPGGARNPSRPRSSITGVGAPNTKSYIADNDTSNFKSTAIATPATSTRELNYSSVRGPVAVTSRPYIDDSALRAFGLASMPQPIHRKGGLHINRSLVFGLLGAPDFASVNSVAGDRAGSSFGLTVDYEFASHWYVGSGLLYSRKVFAAAPQDYHVPQGYYRQNGMGMGNSVQWIKGRFDMLEIPLNLRFDFSTTGNTLFFASGGISSYFFTTENCGYYYEFYSRVVSKQFSYASSPNNLFSTLNFSAGIEAGISNSFSVLVSPYVKIPTRNIGFGQVQLNSFGIDFALRFAPVISRRR